MRRWGVALLLAAWVFAVTGCGGGSSSSSGGSGGAASTDKTPVTITLRNPWTGDQKKPWITVKAIGYPDSDTFDQQIVIKTINAGDPPDAFLSFGPDYVGQYCANDLWIDLSDY